MAEIFQVAAFNCLLPIRKRTSVILIITVQLSIRLSIYDSNASSCLSVALVSAQDSAYHAYTKEKCHFNMNSWN